MSPIEADFEDCLSNEDDVELEELSEKERQQVEAERVGKELTDPINRMWENINNPNG